MSTGERRRRVREMIAELRQTDPAEVAPDPGLAQAKTTLEVLALLIAEARAVGDNECDVVEILLTSTDTDRRELLALETIMAKLGYRDVARTLRRLARTAPSRPSPRTWGERRAERLRSAS